MRKALVVGINYYEHCNELNGCIDDALEVKSALERNADGTLNFDVQKLISANEQESVTRLDLRKKVKDLFEGDSEIALFYYSGHGHIDEVGGYLVTTDSKTGDDGFSLHELMGYVNASRSRSKVIILDSCYSGYVSDIAINPAFSQIAEGVTILTACEKDKYAFESEDRGVFTTLLVDALLGGASNLIGDVTPGGIYAHIDQSLGPWEQRPIFKTNVKNFISIRKNIPPISIIDLKEITNLFINKNDIFELDPTFEPTESTFVKENGEKFKILQSYVRVNLVRPFGEEHMYYAAINNKSCKLTALGVHYWNLVKKNRI